MKKRDFAFGDVRTHSCVIAAEFSADVVAGFRRFQLDFQWFEPPSLPFNQFSPLWPINTFSTDYICSFEFSTGSNGFQLVRWQFQQVVLAVCFQQVFNWSSNRFSTSCDRLAVEFSRDGNRCQTKTASGNFFVYARTAAASVSARGEVMVELRRKGT